VSVKSCDSCDDPAVKTAVLGGTTHLRLCYRHAVEHNILGAPLETIQAISDAVGCSVNGVLFVHEAVARGGEMADARGITWAVIASARERFGRSSSRRILENWGIRTRADIGKVFMALVQAQLTSAVPDVSLKDFDAPFTLGDVLEAP
jgi:uncharacterized repeat protein (TIGR04138 family)